MSVLIKGLNIKPCKDGFDGKGLVIIGYDDKLYAVAHEQIIPLPDHGDLIDKTVLMGSLADWQMSEAPEEGFNWDSGRNVTSHELQYSIYRLLGDVYEEVRDEPVVIPAERSEE